MRKAERNCALGVLTQLHDLGLSVTAEGVETRAPYDALAAKECDEAQEYVIAQPMPAPAFAFAALDGGRKQTSVA